MSKVELYVYDLSNGLARSLSLPLTGRQIDGIWHTSVVVWNREIYYGQGILEVSPPGTTHHGNPLQKIDVGTTHIDESTFEEYLDNMRDHYTGDKYHLLEFNCNSFTNDVVGFLTGGTIPSWITNLPSEFLSTPFGASLRPQIDAMFRRGPAAAGRGAGPSRRPPHAVGMSNNEIANQLLAGVAQSATTGQSSTAASSGTSTPTPLSSSLIISTNSSSFTSALSTHTCVIALFKAPTPRLVALTPTFEDLAKRNARRDADEARGKVGFVVVDLEVGGEEVAHEWGVKDGGFVFFRDGKKVNVLKAPSSMVLIKAVESHIATCFRPLNHRFHNSVISPRSSPRRERTRTPGHHSPLTSIRSMATLYYAIWTMTSVSPVMGDTEIMQFDTRRLGSGSEGVRNVVTLEDQISIKPNQVMRYDFQVQKDGKTVRELLLDTAVEGGGWWFQDRYAVRLSWPANYPTRFDMAVEPTSNDGQQILAISAQHRGIDIPSTSVLRKLPLPRHEHLVPLNVALDQLVFGVIPVVAIRPALLVVAIIAVGWLLHHPVLGLLKWLVLDANTRRKRD